jgi:hypothetical protein
MSSNFAPLDLARQVQLYTAIHEAVEKVDREYHQDGMSGRFVIKVASGAELRLRDILTRLDAGDSVETEIPTRVTHIWEHRGESGVDEFDGVYRAEIRSEQTEQGLRSVVNRLFVGFFAEEGEQD